MVVLTWFIALRPPSDRVAPEKNDWKDQRTSLVRCSDRPALAPLSKGGTVFAYPSRKSRIE